VKIAAPSAANAFHAEHVRLLLDNYRRLLGRPLTDWDETAADCGKLIYNADFALLSHTTDANPLFNYGNRTALALFEYSWDEFIGLPSNYSVQPDEREARERLLQEVGAKGYVENYGGIRIARSGKRFKINRAAVWNLYGHDGIYRGQGAFFKDWEMLGG
jgi:hypothetical protein